MPCRVPRPWALALLILASLLLGQVTAVHADSLEPPVPGDQSARARVRIHGRVTDFDGAPLEGVGVDVKNEKFETVFSARSGPDGRYEILVDPAVYASIYAIRPAEYGKTRLEYWAWNVPALANLEINPQYEKLEIYAVNAFRPQVTPYETFMVYFRPMSLTRVLARFGAERPNPPPGAVVDVAPANLEAKDLEVRVNGTPGRIVSITRAKEYARGSYLFGYLVQVVVAPGGVPAVPGYDLITIVARDPDTGDRGRADYFYRR